MKDIVYILYVVILGGIAVFTGEIVTFVMLGVILIALHNILKVQQEISRKLDRLNQRERE
ncbi:MULTISPECIES: hypothetical protein [Paenibacillus]|uniref:Uncharacterized protein n=1 Tax=Paenibacillus campinasensis TaxID=66347 RepID=A0A268EW66_9BACL|nr:MULTISPECIES: hypothetical protein [Paenibacillus]PAD77376.1 hypothetical protein CHH67_10270 [Paenibacillus campinasensis]PAK50282.1 hypothetical protein CHH75_18180 [Paenibacillus sp. 7541]